MREVSHASSLLSAFDRYEAFTDLKSLKEWSLKPLRKSLRVNTLKCSVEELKKWGAMKNWQLEPVPWCPEGFFIDRPSFARCELRPASRENREEALGKDLLHLLGYFYMQEAASMLPVALLDPQPGERILDMSAAPGSKATQIADAIAKPSSPRPFSTDVEKEKGSGSPFNVTPQQATPLHDCGEGPGVRASGLLLANDVQEKRIWGMLSNLQRCGIVDVIVTKKVGQWFAGNMTEMFDRVLCDAPCTAQGTVRKDPDALKYCSIDNIGKMARLQRELLESAVHACKVGGRIVYSTCTLTSEENEEVVLSILNKFSEQLEVVEPRVNGKWKMENGKLDAAIDDSIRVQQSLKRNFQFSIFNFQFLRLWPQTFDTEGFFCAVLRKKAPTRERSRKDRELHRWPLVPGSRIKELKNRLEDWYGTPFLRDDEALIESREQLMVVPQTAIDVKLPVTPYLAGLPFAKVTSHGLPRLSHEMATLRGREATTQVIVVSEDDLRQMLRGVNIRSHQANVQDGDALLVVDSPILGRRIVVGRGMLKEGTILNRLPREMVRMFA